ncbi:hypothetical protein [Rhodococcus sp. Leaf233]|uniref:hypothetical protein n=1 Tax=Rhodococcus sp. Leaf233 TaxID=1736302 RepID=UPI0012E393CC|nr:hypothetical protein [Rhodococcus sp. Leaf233]
MAAIVAIPTAIAIAFWQTAGGSEGQPYGTVIDSPGGSTTAEDFGQPTNTTAANCSLDGVIAAWGLDPQLDSLLLDVEGEGGTCTVRPNLTSQGAGGSERDIEAASAGVVADVLRECAREAGQPIVPCSELHELEFVGVSFEIDPSSNPDVQCSVSGRKYAAINFVPGAIANFVVLESNEGRVGRCALAIKHGSSTTSLRAPTN